MPSPSLDREKLKAEANRFTDQFKQGVSGDSLPPDGGYIVELIGHDIVFRNFRDQDNVPVMVCRFRIEGEQSAGDLHNTEFVNSWNASQWGARWLGNALNKIFGDDPVPEAVDEAMIQAENYVGSYYECAVKTRKDPEGIVRRNFYLNDKVQVE